MSLTKILILVVSYFPHSDEMPNTEDARG